MRGTAAIPSLLLLLCLTPVLTDAAQDATPVRVTVFYEALCPDSRRFIVGQLYPVWRDLGDIMDVDLHAYGKAKEGYDGKLQCQHGRRECEANQMMTCAKKVTDDPCTFMDFTRCVMEEFKGAEGGDVCANQTGVALSEVGHCVASMEGKRFQHEVGMAQATLSPALSYVPWILVNDVFTWKQLADAQQDLRQVVCGAYEGERPEGCQV